MRIYRKALFYLPLLFFIMASRAFPAAFEEKQPRDEKIILVPKGARPMLKEEYPRGQLVVDRIKARHGHILVIPFVRSWNTAAFTGVNSVEIKEEPELTPNNYELGFALHSQRLYIGSLRNREYFQKETEGFPEGWYRVQNAVDRLDRPTGYMSTSFVHLAAKRIRSRYAEYRDFSDRVGGLLNAVMLKKEQVSLMARRDMQSPAVEGVEKPKTRNTASIFYRMPEEEGGNKFSFYGDSIWSTLIDSAGRKFRYVSGSGVAIWGRDPRPDFSLNLKAKLQITTFRDKIYSFENTGKLVTRVLETRKSGLLESFNVISPADFLKIKLNISALYDSKYNGYFMPGAELALTPKVIQASVGVKRRAILPNRDELYWSSKLVEVNDNLQPEEFWETYGSLNVDILARFRLFAEASYSRPESRLTWEQLPGYVWTPVNAETSEALTGEGYMILDLIGNLGTFASIKYQRFDNQLYDPEIIADAGVYYGRSIRGYITLGASYWKFQPLETTEPLEDQIIAYLRISKSIREFVILFIDGRYAIDRDDLVYYRGMPQAGRVVSFGANFVFGGLD